MTTEPIRESLITDHAAIEMERRGISSEQVRRILEKPEQRMKVREGRDVLHSRVKMEDGLYLIRVFVDVNRTPAEVVTVYRTNKIEKYWRKLP